MNFNKFMVNYEWKMFNEGNQIHNMSSSGSGTVINYGSGSDFLTSYGSGSTSQKVTVPTVPVPVPVPQHWCPQHATTVLWFRIIRQHNTSTVQIWYRNNYGIFYPWSSAGDIKELHLVSRDEYFCRRSWKSKKYFINERRWFSPFLAVFLWRKSQISFCLLLWNHLLTVKIVPKPAMNVY